MLRCLNIVICFLLLIHGQHSSAGEPVVAWSGSSHKIIKSYLTLLNNFKNQSCKKEQRNLFEKYLTDYQRRGHYIPFASQGKWDKKTIKDNLPLLNEKLTWINSLISNLPAKIELNSEINLIRKKNQ